MPYESFVQRTTFRSPKRCVTFEVTPEKMACVEQIAISLGACLGENSSHNHHQLIIDGDNSEKILHSIELAWAALDSYEAESSSLAIVSNRKSIVILGSERNNLIISAIKLIASMAGIAEDDGVMEVNPELYRVLNDFILSQKGE